ncbi:MAG: Sec-independent protein translocase subunit TatA [Corynebacterium camporealensis]|uniref:Sec-independent protein translocase subunit TatA n=1 Tax=Corynebacterium camporealensis TaxID=161896 RepID=UPI002A915BE0|nr:Sec-independent protein translocase subunit TatA [Corynebacterium camporealensis]MDY5840829.1 Sec-independent protein translocase subunit TatA [Corynebacterium camporealensis]
MPGPWEIAIILLIIVLLFGARKLPELARSVGRSMRIFKSEVKEMGNDDQQSAQQPQQGQITPGNQKQSDEEFWNSPDMQPRTNQQQPGNNPQQ